MVKYKRLISVCLFMLCAIVSMAQSSINTPYSRYGFGQLTDQSFGNSKAMGGIAYGLRNGLQINAANPASYSAVDSLTFLFDAGLSLQNTNFKENGVQTNAKNSTLDYIAMQFRLFKGLGLSAGFLPYSTVGYNMSKSKEIGTDQYGNKIQTLESYYGDGGLQQVFIGLGYNVFKNLSVGFNFSYLYGDITHTATTTFNNSNATISSRGDKISVSDYKLDFGIQYSHAFGNKHLVNLGAIYSLGHDVNSDGYKYQETYTSSGISQSQAIDSLTNAFSIPHTFGVGATYVYDKKLTIGIDYTLQKWQDVQYFGEKGAFKNRSKLSLGAEYQPNALSRNYLNRIRYRIGAYYSDPYTQINNREGAREYGVSFGFGLPLFRSKSILNISGQYVKVSPKTKGMLEENCLRVNIGLTFNEGWFMKWKVD